MTFGDRIKDERGTTLMELMVSLAAGMVILFAISTVIIVSLRETNRANARIDAVQRGRIALSKVMDQLHSACIAPQIAPVQVGSTGTSLIFIHQSGSDVTPVPIRSIISLANGTLSQADFQMTGGTAPKWEFATEASSTRPLMTKISPIAPSSSIFTYYSFTSGKLTEIPLATLDENIGRVIAVRVGFAAAPLTIGVKDPNAAANVQNMAVLRLTPTSFSNNGVNLPCQ